MFDQVNLKLAWKVKKFWLNAPYIYFNSFIVNKVNS